MTLQAADSDALTERQAQDLVRRLGRVVGKSPETLRDVLMDLPPADIAVLETVTEITKRRSRQRYDTL